MRINKMPDWMIASWEAKQAKNYHRWHQLGSIGKTHVRVRAHTHSYTHTLLIRTHKFLLFLLIIITCPEK